MWAAKNKKQSQENQSDPIGFVGSKIELSITVFVIIGH